jgi:hypothetical protein
MKEKRKGEEKEQERKPFFLLGYICRKAKFKMKKNLKIDFLGFQLPDVREKTRKTWQSSIFGSHK